MRKQFGDLIGPLCRQSREDVFQICVWVVPIDLSGTHQTHDGSGWLTSA